MTTPELPFGRFARLAVALLAVAVPLWTAAAAAGAPARTADTRAGLHPSDGPDIDVRIRIDTSGVRFKLSPNLAYCDEVTDFVRELEEKLDEAEYDPLLHVLFDTFSEHLVVTIDGERVMPELDGELRVLEALPEMAKYAPVFGARAQTLTEFKLVFPTDVEPSRVSILWERELFPPNWSQNSDWALTRERIPPPMVIRAQINDGSGDSPLEFTVEEPEFVWHGHVTSALERFLPVLEAKEPERVAVPIPTLVLACCSLFALFAGLRAARPARPRVFSAAAIGFVLAAALLPYGRAEFEVGDAEAVTEPEAVAIFEPLHTNMYTAFDFEDRDEIYDALAHCVAGDQLDAVYQQIFRSLIMQDQGGAESRVKAVRHLETHLESSGHLAQYDADGFTVRTRWQVDGVVTHFGHSHERTQEYAGLFTVGDVDGEWRILGDELLEDFTVEANPLDVR
ncbi:MAG: hypothetical protein R3F34_09380 [Planctomycetota bacterium]